MITSNSRATRALLSSTAATSALLILIALATQSVFPFVYPLALCAGCAFALFNLIFFRYLSSAILDADSPRRGLMAALALLKLPLLVILIFILTRQSALVIGNVLAGSLIFIPGALVAALRREKEGENTSDSSPQQ